MTKIYSLDTYRRIKVRTVDLTEMPDDLLMLLLEGSMSYGDAAKAYPGPICTIIEEPADKAAPPPLPEDADCDE